MKLALIVPFRERYNHLSQFVSHYGRNYKNAKIFVIEQAKGKPFNRGAMINAGFFEFQNEFDYFIAHDVDLICTKGDYSYAENPTQLATHAEQFRYTMPFNEYFGGATLFNNQDFIHCNGYSNLFFGYGGEDEEMYNNVIACGLKISYRDCYYRSLPHHRLINYQHGRPVYESKEIELLHKKNIELKNKPRQPNDGLTTLRYSVIKKEVFPLYTQITVEL